MTPRTIEKEGIHMKRSRLLVAALASVALLGVAAVPADSHTYPASKTPASGASRQSGVASITFRGTIRRGTLAVYAPSGRKVSIGSGGRDPRNIKRLVVGMVRNKPAGQYRLRWAIIAADGDYQVGIIRTTLK
jgi:methionine-rich copper-binding protein CopC